MTKLAKEAAQTKLIHVEKHREFSIPIYSKPVGKYQSFFVANYSNGPRIR